MPAPTAWISCPRRPHPKGGPSMKVTQGQFSFLPDLTDAEIIQAGASAERLLEHVGQPDVRPARPGRRDDGTARPAAPSMATNTSRSWHSTPRRAGKACASASWSTAPKFEPGFELVRQEGPGRQLHYTLRSHTHVPGACGGVGKKARGSAPGAGGRASRPPLLSGWRTPPQ
jgi:ribulose-bisphosphate carboxylase small chain